MLPLLRRSFVQRRPCAFALEGEARSVEHGYAGLSSGGMALPRLPRERRWRDASASEYLLVGYGPLVSRHFNSPGRPVNVTERTRLLRRITRDLHQLEAAMGHAGPRTCTTYVELMCRAGVMGRPVVGMPERLAKLGVRPPLRMYNAILQTYANFGRLRDMRDVRAGMRASGVRADVHTYNALLTCLLKRKEFQKVATVLREMVEEKVEPTDITYDKAIASAAGLHEGLEMLAAMRARGVREKPEHYVGLIAACRREPQADDMARNAEEAMRLVAAANLGPSPQHYDALLTVYKETGDMAGLRQVLADRVREGVALTPLTYTVLVSACAAQVRGKNDAAAVDEAEKTFGRAVAGGAQGFAQLHQEMLRVYVNARDVAKGEALAASLHGSLHHVLNSTAFLLLLHRLYDEGGEPVKARATKGRLFQRLRTLGFSPQASTRVLEEAPEQNARTIAGAAGRPAQAVPFAWK